MFLDSLPRSYELSSMGSQGPFHNSHGSPTLSRFPLSAAPETRREAVMNNRALFPSKNYPADRTAAYLLCQQQCIVYRWPNDKMPEVGACRSLECSIRLPAASESLSPGRSAIDILLAKRLKIRKRVTTASPVICFALSSEEKCSESGFVSWKIRGLCYLYLVKADASRGLLVASQNSGTIALSLTKKFTIDDPLRHQAIPDIRSRRRCVRE